MSCLICAEHYNKSSRKNTRCEYCEFEACRSCCKTFILGEPVAKCMNTECKKEWTRQFITTAFGQTFANKQYKQHREQLIYDKERALLPATQPIVERIQLVRQLRNELKEIAEEQTRLLRRKREISYTITTIENSPAERERTLFTKACSAANCRGFLNTQWKCGLCQSWTCPDCHEIKGAEHTCNPDTVATAKLLAADTKSCPKCSTSIHKIDGCDQMWCTICHTAFSWRTGRTESAIHNPHYFEYMRKQSPTGEIPRTCNGEMNYHIYETICWRANLRRKYLGYPQDIAHVGEIVRNVVHITHSELRRYPAIDVGTNEDLRVSYMLGEISETTFKVLLQRSEKGTQKRQQIREIFLMIQTTSSDIINRLCENLLREELKVVIPTTIIEIAGVAEYANEQFAKISKTFNSSSIHVNSILHVG